MNAEYLNLHPKYPRTNEYDSMKEKIKTWFDESLESGKLFTVNVGKDNFSEIFERCEKKVERTFDNDGHEKVLVEYIDAPTNTKFTLEATLYADFPTVDYVIWIENTSDKENTPIVNNWNAIDSVIKITPRYYGRGYDFTTSEGCVSLPSSHDFMPYTRYMSSGGNERVYTCGYGQFAPSAEGWPYFDVFGENCGVMLAIGWSGLWEAGFTGLWSQKFRIRAKQWYLNTLLMPKEKIRSPRIVLTYYEGDNDYGHNVFRKLLVEHYTPKNYGDKGFYSPMCMGFWGGTYEPRAIKQIERYIESGVEFDAAWFDAGWNGGSKFSGDDKFTSSAGGRDWEAIRGWLDINPEVFPSGSFKKVADLLHKHGKKLVVWWQFEQANALLGEHLNFGRDSYYRKSRNTADNHIINIKFSDEEVYQKLVDYFDKFFTENGIDYFRVDGVNDTPILYDNDDYETEKFGLPQGSRLGITENKYIVNYYRFWDELAKRHPGFLLDNCAGGGRRLDIEMTKRSLPLWRTDYDCDQHPDLLEARQAQTQWISKWLPFSSAACCMGLNDYDRRSCLSISPPISWSATQEDQLEGIAKLTKEINVVRPYWYGCYYQLLNPSVDFDTWQAYELFREDWNKGVAVVIRRANAPEDMKKIYLKGLCKDSKYLVHDINDEDNVYDFVATGASLMERGFESRIEKRDIRIYKISEVK